MNNIELCKRVVSILANSGDMGKYIIGEVCETLENDNIHIAQPNWNTMRGKLNYTQIAEEKGWLIQRNKIFKQYRLVGPDNKSYVSILQKDKFVIFLEKIIQIGNEQNIGKSKPTMTIYQVIVDEHTPIKENCKSITLNELDIKFPNTKNRSAGYYTIHPCDPKSLTPIEEYYTNIALDQDDERIVLLGKIGAKSVHIQRIDISNKNNKFNANIDMPKTVKVEVGNSIFSSLQESFNLFVEFEGNKVNIDENLLDKSIWYKKDSEMNGFLTLRLNGNRITQRDITVKSSKRFNFDISAAASIIGIADIEIKNEYEEVTKTMRKFHVIFPE